jgi:antitoxin FitA-like protein
MSHDVHHEEVPTNAITVRNLPPAVAKAVKDKARKERLSLNQAIVRLLEEATGEKRSKKVAHHDLDHLAGKWSEEQYQQFMDALREQRQIDPEMWK